MGGSRVAPIVTSDDEDKPVAPPADAADLPDAEYYEWPAAKWSEHEDPPRPDWLPDGFGMEGYYEADDTFKATNFFCPVTGISFGTKTQVDEYCVSGGMERAVEAKNTLDDKTTLQGKYAWLRGNHKWVLEIRAGGENRSKMFKVYAHPASKVRVTSKDEVMRLIDEGTLPNEFANDGDCNDTSSKDNIVAQLDFNVLSLPPGWVKEIAFRKCSDGIRTDRYYTDPVTKKVFRSLKAAEQYFAYEKIMDCYKPNMSVTDLYSFDGYMDMPPCLARRLKMGGTEDQSEEECHPSCQTLTIKVGEEGEEVFHGDSEDKLDEEECHGDDTKEEDKEEALYGDENEKEDNKEKPHGDGKEDDDEPGAPHDSDKKGVNGEGMLRGDGMEDDEEHWRFRSLTELYSIQVAKGNLKRKGKKKNILV